MEKVELTNAKELAELNPNTFERPTQSELMSLNTGDFVKVCPTHERFWVKLTKVEGEYLEGAVDNDLISTDEHGYALGDSLVLHVDDVYSIETQK